MDLAGPFLRRTVQPSGVALATDLRQAIPRTAVQNRLCMVAFFLLGAAWTSGHAVVSGAAESYRAMCASG